MKLQEDEYDAPHIMLDLETMGTGPNAAIVAIGAVAFGLDGSGITNRFYQSVDLKNAVNNGGVIDADSVMWWLDKSNAARLALQQDAIPVYAALLRFKLFIDEVSVDSSLGVRVWGNGVDFDNVILSNAYKRSGLGQPYYFKNSRCYRSIKTLFNSKSIDEFRVGEHHNAINDAESQALHLMHILGAS